MGAVLGASRVWEAAQVCRHPLHCHALQSVNAPALGAAASRSQCPYMIPGRSQHRDVEGDQHGNSMHVSMYAGGHGCAGKDLWVDVHARVQGTNSAKVMGASDKGMVLPFQPLSLTFHHMDYYVKLPKVPALPVHGAAKRACRGCCMLCLQGSRAGDVCNLQQPNLRAASLLVSSACVPRRHSLLSGRCSSRSYLGCL